MKLNQYEWNPEKDLIAQGAFAEVFKAKDTNSQDRYVALKIYKEAAVKGTSGSTGQEKYTLEKEFQKIDGLSHTNIITYFGINYIKHKDALGRSSSYPVIIMEYASEGTLQDFIKTNPDTKILDKIIQDIIQGVSYLHDEGIIHRDLKPGNILITKNRKGEPVAKITDFGISRDTLTDKTIEESFTEGIGTPHYMAPEQFFKKKFGLKGEISERTDIWALGVVIYRALTNKLPFGHGSKDYELIRDAIIESEVSFKNIPKKYHLFLEACLQKEAVKRPSAVKELLKLFKLEKEAAIEVTKINQSKKPINFKKDEKIIEKYKENKSIIESNNAIEEETIIPNNVNDNNDSQTEIFEKQKKPKIFKSIRKKILVLISVMVLLFTVWILISIIHDKIWIPRKFDKLIVEGNQYFMDKEYKKALTSFKKAKSFYMLPISHQVSVKIREIEKILITLGISDKHKTIFFSKGSSKLTDLSLQILDVMVQIMNDNPSYNLNMHGYTSSIGNTTKNLELSKDRTKIVESYLVKKGVNSKRLASKNFGETNLVASDSTSKTSAFNSRVELIVEVKIVKLTN